MEQLLPPSCCCSLAGLGSGRGPILRGPFWPVFMALIREERGALYQMPPDLFPRHIRKVGHFGGHAPLCGVGMEGLDRPQE